MTTTEMIKPKTFAELLPELGGIVPKDAMRCLTTAKKQPRQTIANSLTAEKVLKPLTIAEMKKEMKALKVQSPRRNNQAHTASMKKKWNSSVKLENKFVSYTAGTDGQIKHNSVRKVLNFQPKKPKATNIVPNSRMTIMNTETPRFPKPELKVKKSTNIKAPVASNVSGVYQIPETPIINKPAPYRMTLANKENISNQVLMKKKIATPKSALRKKALMNIIPPTPSSDASSCDASFLQNEREIEQNELKKLQQSLEDIAEVTPPASTPFKDYRSVKDFFNNSSEVMDSCSQDNTIMCFDAPSKDNEKPDESVIVSLCEMLNRATVSKDKINSDLQDLLEVEKKTIDNIKMIENGIQILKKIKAADLNSLQFVRKLIEEKRRTSESDKDKTVIENTKEDLKVSFKSPNSSKPCSVIKSPSYKIPKKNTMLRRKSLCKSMPNVSNLTPQKDMGNKALHMYMKLKEHMNFLNTPVVKKRTEVPDTPAITSHNLQKQLDKLYAES